MPATFAKHSILSTHAELACVGLDSTCESGVALTDLSSEEEEQEVPTEAPGGLETKASGTTSEQ